MKNCRKAVVAVLILALGAGCHQSAPQAGPLRERGYLWQRDWNPAVAAGFLEAERRMDGVVVLGSEISWADGASQTVRATIEWEDLRGESVALAVRVAPYGGPFALDAGPYPALAAEVSRLLKEAAAHGVQPEEMQIDFDCAARKLAGYAIWLRALRQVAGAVPLVITTLPAWLDERDFPALAREADYYVLQVHSVPTLAESGHAVLCDPALARKWVGKASRLGIPFSVSLPAYWCLAGYDQNGKLLGVAMDSVQPAWPPGTSALEFAANAEDIAGLVAEWRKARPMDARSALVSRPGGHGPAELALADPRRRPGRPQPAASSGSGMRRDQPGGRLNRQSRRSRGTHRLHSDAHMDRRRRDRLRCAAGLDAQRGNQRCHIFHRTRRRVEIVTRGRAEYWMDTV